MGDQILNRSFDPCWGKACTVMIQLSMAIINDRFWPKADIKKYKKYSETATILTITDPKRMVGLNYRMTAYDLKPTFILATLG